MVIIAEEIISKELLDILACPDCKGDLALKKNTLVCAKCKEVFEIKEGIPILLPKRPINGSSESV